MTISTTNPLGEKRFEVFSDEEKNLLNALASVVEFKSGTNLTVQYAPAENFYLLVKGTVEFSILLENENEFFVVGESEEILTPIGWSGFRSPHRYATTDKLLTEGELLKWSHQDLRKLFDLHPILGSKFLKLVFDHALELLNGVRSSLSEYQVTTEPSKSLTEAGIGKKTQSHISNMSLLRRSPYFEIFSEQILNAFSEAGQRLGFATGEIIENQGDPSKGFDFLVQGKVSLIYNPGDGKKSISTRLVNEPGYCVTWAGGVKDGINDVTSVALTNTTILRITPEKVESILSTYPQFALAHHYRLLWLIGNFLRGARTRLISFQFEKEILAIRNLLQQNTTQLPVGSSLFKIPHLLDQIATIEDAFDILNKVKQNGSTLEKSLANSCLDILNNVHRENDFYKGLIKVYEKVVSSPDGMESELVRKENAEQFIDVFSQIPHVISGEENLPDEGGNIFIYNHLLNHPYNTLPNNFQLTLDSHFVSSMVIFKKYGKAPIRVVRVGRNVEFGHQYYYSKLGHINVYTPESEKIKETDEDKKRRKDQFFNEAKAFLEGGENILISPEGTSKKTEDSPGQFKIGAFRLAQSMGKPIKIVPISVANFDKRVNRAVFSLMIHEPIYVPENFGDVDNKTGLIEFVNDLQKKFVGYVKETKDQIKQT